MPNPAASGIVGGLTNIGGSLLGASMGANAARQASGTMANTQDEARRVAYETWLQQQGYLDPFALQSQNALNRLNYAMYGQAPTAQSMRLNVNTPEYQNYVKENPNFAGGALYRNPMTGAITTEAPDITNAMGVKAGSLDPSYRYGYSDFQASPEKQVYDQAQAAALRSTQDTLAAQGAASGAGGSGNIANALARNTGELYAQYQPAAYQAAQQAALGQRQNELGLLMGMASPQVANQLAGYAGQYGANAGNFITGRGQAQAWGTMGAANAWRDAIPGITGELGGMASIFGGKK